MIGENTNYALTEKVRAIGVVVINLFITITNARRLINMNYKSRSLYYCTSFNQRLSWSFVLFIIELLSRQQY